MDTLTELVFHTHKLLRQNNYDLNDQDQYCDKLIRIAYWLEPSEYYPLYNSLSEYIQTGESLDQFFKDHSPGVHLLAILMDSNTGNLIKEKNHELH